MRAVVYRHFSLPQSSSASRFTAGAAGFLNPLRHDAFEPELAGMPENRFPVAFDVLVVIFSSSFLVMSVLLTREDFHEVPLRVEYGITKFGNDQAEAMRPLCESGAKHMKRISGLPIQSSATRRPVAALYTGVFSSRCTGRYARWFIATLDRPTLGVLRPIEPRCPELPLSCRFGCEGEVAEIGRLIGGAFRPEDE
jgi:HxlR-like helix-turn-helix